MGLSLLVNLKMIDQLKEKLQVGLMVILMMFQLRRDLSEELSKSILIKILCSLQFLLNLIWKLHRGSFEIVQLIQFFSYLLHRFFIQLSVLLL
jgi:hypothetical protein